MRFGLLGTGFFADHHHAATLAAHPDTELVGVWGRDPGRAIAVAARHGVRAYSDLDRLLEEVDAVAIAVAPDAQPALAIRAADAGCHLLLEKPLALSSAEAEAVVAAAERNRVASVVYLSFLWAGTPWLDSVAAPSTWRGGRGVIVTPLLTTDNPFAAAPWRRQVGPLWEAGPHALSYLVAALGPVTEVSAERGGGDVVELALRHESGRVSSVLVGFSVPNAVDHFEWTLWGEAGVLHPEQDDDGARRAVSALLDAARTGVPPRWDARFAAHLVATTDAAERFLARSPGTGGERVTVRG